MNRRQRKKEAKNRRQKKGTHASSWPAKRFAERAHREQKRIAIAGIIVGAAIGVAGVIATLASGVFASNSAAVTTKSGAPSISDQWLSVRHRLARNGWSVRMSRREELRPDGRASTILVLRRSDPRCARSRSEQVRIFDVDHGRLQQTFVFEPSAHGDCETALNFEILGVGKFQSDADTRDLVALFSTNEGGPQGIEVPVVIYWDPGIGRYHLRGLLRSGADLVSFDFNTGPLRGTDKDWFDGAVELFSKPYALSSRVKAWGASSVLFRARGDAYAPLLVGLYRLNAGNAAPVGEIGGPNDRTPIVYERAVWSFYTNSNGLLQAGNCSIGKRDVVTTEDRPPEAILREFAGRASVAIEGCDTDPTRP